MLPSLAALIVLQTLDSAVDAAHRRLSELPASEQALETKIAVAAAAVATAKARLQESHTARRALEKDVAAVDTRLARFEEHKAAVKTNQEYTALLHEVAAARAEKDGLEERILGLMEDADTLAAEVKADEATLALATSEGTAGRAALKVEGDALEAEVTRLNGERTKQAAQAEARALATYEQLLKGRRGIAVARMIGETCGACHVRLRPHVVQLIRRNDEIVQCESCRRILHHTMPGAAPEASGPTP